MKQNLKINNVFKKRSFFDILIKSLSEINTYTQYTFHPILQNKQLNSFMVRENSRNGSPKHNTVMPSVWSNTMKLYNNLLRINRDKEKPQFGVEKAGKGMV